MEMPDRNAAAYVTLSRMKKMTDIVFTRKEARNSIPGNHSGIAFQMNYTDISSCLPNGVTASSSSSSDAGAEFNRSCGKPLDGNAATDLVCCNKKS